MLAIIAFAIGASVGSFLNVVADRIPEGQSLVHPRSHCPSCQRPLPNIELVPVLSYLWLRGRCRGCGANIPARLLAVEVVTGLLFAVIYLRFVGGLDTIAISIVMAAAVALLVVVAVIDLERGLILNRVVFPSAIVLLILSPLWSELGLDRSFLGSASMLASLANSLVAGVGAFLFFLVIVLAYPKGMGGGDVKLAGLIGLMVGYPGVVVALYAAVIIGGLVALSLLVFRLKGRKDPIPFGPYLSLGGIGVLLAGDDMISGWEYVLDRIAGL